MTFGMFYRLINCMPKHAAAEQSICLQSYANPMDSMPSVSIQFRQSRIRDIEQNVGIYG